MRAGASPGDEAADRPSRRSRRAARRRPRRAGRPRSSRRSTSRRARLGHAVAQVVKVSASARLRREPPASARSSLSSSSTPSIAGTARGVDLRRAGRAAAASSWMWPSRPKPVTSVSACAPAARACSRGAGVERRHDLDRRASTSSGDGQAALERGRDRRPRRAAWSARARRPARPPALVSTAPRVDDARDRQAVLGLGVVDRVPADDRGARRGDGVARRRAGSRAARPAPSVSSG